jgi:hypothetical protein
MYKTTKTLAKILIDSVGIDASRGNHNMFKYREHKPSMIEKCKDELSVFAQDYIDQLEESDKIWRGYEGWYLKDENTIVILHSLSTKDGKIIADPDYSQFRPMLHPAIAEIPDTILPPDRCYSFQYNTPDDLNQFKIGDTITLKFQAGKHYVKAEYRGNTIQFKVMGLMKHDWRIPTQRLALVPITKLNNYKESDILYLDDTDRFECLMIDLFGCNRIGYRGWKSKTVKIIKTPIDKS